MNDLVVFDKVKAEIEAYKEENRALVFDYEDPGDNKEARSHVHKLRGVKTQVTAVHKDLKAEALAFCRTVDAKKKELIGEVDEMIEVHAAPIKAIQDRKDAAFAAIAERERLEKEQIEFERLEKIRQQEEAAVAETARLQAERDQLERDKEKLAVQQRAEEDAKKREAAIRESAERDKQEAIEKAERDKQAAAMKAGRDKVAAVEAEKERARQQTAADDAVKERLAEEERKRTENKRHRKKTEDAACAAINKILCDIDTSRQIVNDICDGKITNVTINY